jgi:hypothetical protein
VIAELTNFTPRQLEKVIEGAAILRLQKQKRILAPRESELFRIINRGLTETQQKRLEILREKGREGIITQKEQAELLRYSDQLEALSVERLKALMELAAIQKTSVSKLLRKLQISNPTYG